MEVRQLRGIHTDAYQAAMEHLVGVVQDLSRARDLNAITTIVRSAARALLGADGATFVLRDDDQCYYADEDAISPLWKGQRFPMSACISGWVMTHAQPVVIEDIYSDPRVPAEAYRPTFVKSLAMVPIRLEHPIGAIGNYWASTHVPNAREIAVLQALANVTSVSMENVELYNRLLEKVDALEESNQELGRFAWLASHDLKSPLRAIDNLSQWLEEDLGGHLDGPAREHMDTLRRRVRRMERLLSDLLEYARMEIRPTVDATCVSGRALVADVTDLVYVPPGFVLEVSPAFDQIRVPLGPLQRVLCNLLDNAVKHHHKVEGKIHLGVEELDTCYVFSVRDDGPGIPAQYQQKIFEMFQTLQPRHVKEGSGMGLAIVKKTLEHYGSEVTVESEEGRGTVFRFAWPKPLQDAEGVAA